MTVRVFPDIIRDSDYEETIDTVSLTRNFWVERVPTSGVGYNLMKDAVAAVKATGVTLTSAHPSGNGCLVTGYKFTPNNKNDAGWVHVQYFKRAYTQNVNGCLYSFDGSTGNEILDHDKNNNPIKTRWYPEALPGSAVTGDYKESSGGTTSVLKPYMVLNVKKWVSTVGMTTSAMEAHIAAYLGYVNSATWHSGNPYTWLCQNIKATSPDGIWYLLDYTFMYKPLTWYGFMAYTKDNGHRPANLYRGYNFATNPPTALTSNNGFKLCDNYFTTDFNSLGF